jgi:DNA end-binding protein Ku
MSVKFWSGTIGLGPVTLAVRAYAALDAQKSRISLNQLHDECHSRIRTRKFCPLHGDLGTADIVTGFQLSPDQFAVFTSSEIHTLRSGIDGTITVDQFVPSGEIDPIYFSGTTYYLAPNGPSAQKPYQILHRAMAGEDVWGLARAVIYRCDRLVMVRPVEQLLTISTLHYGESIRPAAMFEAYVDDCAISTEALTLIWDTVGAMRTDHPQLEEYRNPYNEQLAALVEVKVADGEIVTSVDDGQPPAGGAAKTPKPTSGKAGSQPAHYPSAGGQQPRPQVRVKRRKSG